MVLIKHLEKQNNKHTTTNLMSMVPETMVIWEKMQNKWREGASQAGTLTQTQLPSHSAEHLINNVRRQDGVQHPLHSTSIDTCRRS